MCQRQLAQDLCQLVLDLIDSREKAPLLRRPADQFTTVHDRLGDHPDPAIGHYLENPDNTVVIKDYFRTFEVAEALARNDTTWRGHLTPTFEATGILPSRALVGRPHVVGKERTVSGARSPW